MAKKTQKNQPNVDDLKAPLLAAVGAADLALSGSTRSSPPSVSGPARPAPTPRRASRRAVPA